MADDVRLSPSSVFSYTCKCPLQTRIFHKEKHRALPGIAQNKGKWAEQAILPQLLLPTNQRVTGKDFAELYVETVRSDETTEAAFDLEEHGGIAGIIDREARMAPLIAEATETFRLTTDAEEIQKEVRLRIGGYDVLGYIDAVVPSEEEKPEPLDYKRRLPNAAGRKQKLYTEDDAAKSIQLTTYSLALGAKHQSFATMVEGVQVEKPAFSVATAEVTPEQIKYTEELYHNVGRAWENDIFPPISKESSASWVCQERFCGAWKRDARDMLTGELIACPYGERGRTR